MSRLTPHARRVVLAALLGAVAPAVASAASPAVMQEVTACLRLQDVACAEAVVEREGLATSAGAMDRAIAAQVAFQAADYPAAYDLMKSAVEDGFDEDDGEQLALYERTMYATAGFVEEAAGRFRVRYRPGVEAILVDDVVATLAATDARVVPLIGEPPPGRTVVELYPDGRSFIAASSLTLDDVEATGAIAISKWTRLLVTSPRALARGYEWQSTLSHEYLHLVVSRATADRAPVWLQEGIAKYLDHAWTGEPFALSRRQQGLLSDALAEHDLVGFDEMHPSLAKIKVYGPDGEVDPEASAKRSGTAYAQLSTLIQYAFEQGGDDVLLTTLGRVKDGVDPRHALAEAAGAPSFSAFLASWETWLRAQDLGGADLRELPVVLDGGDDADVDPVMARRKDLANFLRLGDLLAGQERWRAALVEYDKARDAEDPNSPLLSNRMAASMVALGDRRGARRLLESSLDDYPTFARSWKSLGELDLLEGQRSAAIRHLEEARSLSPFDMAVQEALLQLYRETGDAAGVRRQEAITTILRRGGPDEELPVIHERSGTYELPRDPEIAAAENGPEGLMDADAPDFTVSDLDGVSIALGSLSGKVVILDFWATWCGPCRAVMPRMSQWQERWGDQGLAILGISDEDENVVKRFVATEARRGNTFQQTLALEDGSVRGRYGVSSLPTMVVIDQAGTIRLVHVGAQRMDEVEKLVARLLGVATPEVIP